MLKTKNEIKAWLDKYGIAYYTINDDLTVDVGVDVNLSHKGLYEIPIQFGIVEGNFWCELNQLTSLRGCPFEVRGDFYCSNNKLINLKDAPKIVEGNFNCAHNSIITINDFECKVLGIFSHSCYFGTPSKIQELKNYYKQSQFNHAVIQMSLLGKELENVICERYLQKNLPINSKENKKLKI